MVKIKIGEEKYRIDIVKKINGKINKVNSYINQNEFDKLKVHVDNQPVLTKKLIFSQAIKIQEYH